MSNWSAFHNAWLTNLVRVLKPELPPDFYAEPTARFNIEIGMAALERLTAGGPGGWQPTWESPPADSRVALALMTDELEVLVYEDAAGGLRLVGAVEFVSPANKDRPEAREAFVTKCADYLFRGSGWPSWTW
jgi:hypothetical protein